MTVRTKISRSTIPTVDETEDCSLDAPPTDTMDSQYVVSWEPAMAEHIYQEARKVVALENRPYMVALVGIPGSGKSVSASLLAAKLQELGCSSMILPHDGYHLSMASLLCAPDAPDVIYRRGAPDTFDSAALYRDLIRIRNGDEGVITVPAFDHAMGDPEPNRHVFDRNQHQVVLCEGLYFLHDGPGWEDLASSHHRRILFDVSIFINSNVDDCIERVKIRNQCIPGYTREEIEIRCEKVDRVNAMTVMKSKARADIVVEANIHGLVV